MAPENATAVLETTPASADETEAATGAAVPALATANHATRTATANQKKRNPLLLLLRLLLHPPSP